MKFLLRSKLKSDILTFSDAYGKGFGGWAVCDNVFFSIPHSKKYNLIKKYDQHWCEFAALIIS